MAGRFEGKVAIVTGGASALAARPRCGSPRRGKRARRRPGRVDGRRDRRLIEAAGGAASFEVVDVRSEDSVAAMVATAVERYGGLDVAHNNAGVVDRLMRITEMGSDRWTA